MDLKKLAVYSSLLGLLAGPSCGYTGPGPTVKVEGTTKKLVYSPGEKIELKGPAESNHSQQTFALKSFNNTNINQSFKIKTKSRQFTPDGKTLFSPEVLKQMESFPKERMHVMLQYTGNLTNNEIQELEEKGISISHPVSTKTYWAEVPLNADLESILNTSKHDIRFVGEGQLEDKLTPLWNKTADGRMKGFNVIFHTDVTYEEAINALNEAGAEIRNSLVSKKIKSFGVAAIQGNNKDLAERIVSLDEVWLVSQASPLKEMNLVVREVSGANYIYNYTGLDGSGSLNIVYDSGCAHHEPPDVEGRTRLGDCIGSPGAHATHVNGTVVGNGKDTVRSLNDMCNKPYIDEDFDEICELFNSTEDKSIFDGAFRGVAPAAESIAESHGGCDEFCIVENPNNMMQDFINGTKEGAVSGGASLGENVRHNGFPCDHYGWYESVATMMDFLVRGDFGNEPIAVTWSAGNERYNHENNRRCYREGFPVGEEFYTMLGGPPTGKNIETIGATQFKEGCAFIINGEGMIVPDMEKCERIIAKYTSFAPLSEDNPRVKPTYVTHGGGDTQGMISLRINEGYQGMFGTSMSRPAADGMNSLLNQQYQITFHTTDKIHPQLLLAVKTNSADDMKVGDNQYVDFKVGFGDLNVKGAAELIANERFVEGEMLETGEAHSYFFEVSDDRDLEATLAYLDYPGKFIINDLDITLISPSGKVFHPHVLDAANPQKIAERKRDEYNNIEKITIDQPEEKEKGSWELRINTYDLVAGTQPYAAAFGHASFELKDATVTLMNDALEQVEGRMSFMVEKGNCKGTACTWERSAPLHDGPSIVLEPGKPHYFNNDFPYFTAPRAPGNYRITASFRHGSTYKNEDGTFAERHMYFSVKKK